MIPVPPPVRLVVFDVDGTLVDSRATIVACARDAFAAAGLEPPPNEAIRRIVGLSLPEAMAVLLGRHDPALAARIAGGYREAFLARRGLPGFEDPLFPGALAALEAIAAAGLPMGVATGKAMRGLLTVLERHALGRFFGTLQTADLHPSKPHPAMLRAAVAEAGVRPEEAVMVGDTTYDVLMARAAGLRAVGVAWGNHAAAELAEAGAELVLDAFDGLAPHLGVPRGGGGGAAAAAA